ncbi:MAG: methyltransferase domain-containing protein [Thermoplasmata archaeon]
MPTWDPGQYLRFERQRGLAVHDLVARLHDRSPKRIVDLGCGAGPSTALLRQRWPTAYIEGIDSSAEMLAAARPTDPSTVWQHGDLRDWQASEPFDLVFSNAALHWVPEHERLFARLISQVAPGGALAVQMPVNSESPAHRAIRDTAAEPRWAPRWGPELPRANVEAPERYYRFLAPASTAIELWQTEYVHVLPDAPSIVEWVKGTTLRPYLDALPMAADRGKFLEEIAERIAAAYPAESDGRVLFPFRRQFLVAHR